MSDDLVKRLRAAAKHPMMDNNCKADVFDVADAADRIEELEAKLAVAVKAFEEIKRYSPCGDSRRKAIDTIAELKGEDRG